MRELYKKEASAIINALDKFEISFIIPPIKLYLKPAFYRNLIIKIGRNSFEIPVHNEFDDIETANNAVLLQYVLMECEIYEEAEDFLVWMEDIGSFGDIDLSRKIYFELREVVPKILHEIQPPITPISSFDVQLNAGAMQIIRAWKP